jgi:hypothetical protein
VDDSILSVKSVLRYIICAIRIPQVQINLYFMEMMATVETERIASKTMPSNGIVARTMRLSKSCLAQRADAKWKARIITSNSQPHFALHIVT